MIKGFSLPGENLHLLSCRPYLIHFKRGGVVEEIVAFHKIGLLVLQDSVRFQILWLVICGCASASRALESQNRNVSDRKMATTVPAYRILIEHREEEA